MSTEPDYNSSARWNISPEELALLNQYRHASYLPKALFFQVASWAGQHLDEVTEEGLILSPREIIPGLRVIKAEQIQRTLSYIIVQAKPDIVIGVVGTKQKPVPLIGVGDTVDIRVNHVKRSIWKAVGTYLDNLPGESPPPSLSFYP